MAIIISCVNLKGGVGKTALAVNFSAYCGMQGKKTLLVDLDPQTNATFSCISVDEWQKHAAEHGTIAHLLGARRHASAEDKKVTAEDVIRKDVFPNVDLIPSHMDLFTIDLDLASATARELKLKKALQPIAENYDVIVCDCPPNLTIPTQNAIAASTHYIVPISPDFLSAIGVGLLIKRVKELSEDLDHKIDLAGIVISRVGRPALHREQTVETLRKQFGDDVISVDIKERVEVSKACEANKSIFQMNDKESASQFEDVSKELLERIGA